MGTAKLIANGSSSSSFIGIFDRQNGEFSSGFDTLFNHRPPRLIGCKVRCGRLTEVKHLNNFLSLSGNKRYDGRVWNSLVQHITTVLIMDDFCARCALPLAHFNDAPIDRYVSFQCEREIVA
jgi:hypothetical protein